MSYSILNCSNIEGDLAEGYWIQDCSASFADAIELAEKTKVLNGNKIIVAVVPSIPSTTPLLSYWTNQKVLHQV